MSARKHDPYRGPFSFTAAESKLALGLAVVVLLISLVVVYQRLFRPAPQVSRDVIVLSALVPPAMPESTFAQSSVTNQARAAGTARSVPVNVNTADYPELLRLPGIGPVLAGRIMAHRDHYGPFAAVDSLIRISGIGPAKLAKLRPLLCVQ